MNPNQAQEMIERVIWEIVPDAEFGDLDQAASLRQWFELDSLDFLNLVERLTQLTGQPITEDDYPALVSMASAVQFLVARTGTATPTNV